MGEAQELADGRLIGTITSGICLQLPSFIWGDWAMSELPGGLFHLHAANVCQLTRVSPKMPITHGHHRTETY